LRRFEAGALLEIFLVAAISAVLTIRFVLGVTGYPKLGGSNLHVSHMVFGGVGMLIAIVILLVGLSRLSAQVAAIIGGFGFGAFIDELGKALTNDNNYFFRPAIAIIYLVFALLTMAFRALGRQARPSSDAYLVNALELTKEAVIRDLDADEKRHALESLRRCDQRDPRVLAVKTMLQEIEAVPAGTAGPLVRVKHSLADGYRHLVMRGHLAPALVTVFVATTVIGLVQMLTRFEDAYGLVLTALVLALAMGAIYRAGARARTWRGVVAVIGLGGILAALLVLIWRSPPDFNLGGVSFAEWGGIVSSLCSAILVIIGMARLRFSRLAAYQMFERALLVAIFVTEVFAFYREQLAAIAGLAFNVLILVTVRYMMIEEQDLSRQRAIAKEA
jgi:hypothetical protein